MFINIFPLVFVTFFLLDFNRFSKYVYISILSTFRMEVNRINTIKLTFNQFYSIENFDIFLEFSWIVVMIALASSFLILILDLPGRLFLIDRNKKKVFKQNMFCQKSAFISASRIYVCFWFYWLTQTRKLINIKNWFNILRSTYTSDFCH